MKKITIPTIILLLIISGCWKSNKNSSGDYVTINVSNDYPEKKLILQDIMDVEYIPLETTDEFITHGNVLDVGKKYLIVRNSVNDGNIFVFDRKTGKGIRKINRLGQGAEEYPGIAGITLDEDNDELFVTNAGKISVYDLYGNFKRCLNFIDTESDYLRVFNYDKDHLITYNNRGTGMIADKQPYHLIFSKRDGSVIREIETPSEGHKTLVIFGENDEKIVPIFAPTIPAIDSWILMNLSSDTLYSYLPDGSIKPFIVRKPSIYSMNTEIFLFVEEVTSRYYFMRTIKKELDKKGKLQVGTLAYDKQEDRIFKYEIHNVDFVYERPVYWISSFNHDITNWYPFDASELTEAYKDGNLKGRLKEIAAKLNEDSNPVIMLMKHQQ